MAIVPIATPTRDKLQQESRKQRIIREVMENQARLDKRKAQNQTDAGIQTPAAPKDDLLFNLPNRPASPPPVNDDLRFNFPHQPAPPTTPTRTPKPSTAIPGEPPPYGAMRSPGQVDPTLKVETPRSPLRVATPYLKEWGPQHGRAPRGAARIPSEGQPYDRRDEGIWPELREWTSKQKLDLSQWPGEVQKELEKIDFSTIGDNVPSWPEDAPSLNDIFGTPKTTSEMPIWHPESKNISNQLRKFREIVAPGQMDKAMERIEHIAKNMGVSLDDPLTPFQVWQIAEETNPTEPNTWAHLRQLVSPLSAMFLDMRAGLQTGEGSGIVKDLFTEGPFSRKWEFNYENFYPEEERALMEDLIITLPFELLGSGLGSIPKIAFKQSANQIASGIVRNAKRQGKPVPVFGGAGPGPVGPIDEIAKKIQYRNELQAQIENRRKMGASEQSLESLEDGVKRVSTEIDELQTATRTTPQGTPHYKDSFAREMRGKIAREYRVHKVGNKYTVQGRDVDPGETSDWESLNILFPYKTKKAAIEGFAETSYENIESFDSSFTAAITKRREIAVRRGAERASAQKVLEDNKETVQAEMKAVKFKKTTIERHGKTGYEYKGLMTHKDPRTGYWVINHVNSRMGVAPIQTTGFDSPLSLADAKVVIYQLSKIHDWENPAMGKNVEEVVAFLKSNPDISNRLKRAASTLTNAAPYSDISEFLPETTAARVVPEPTIGAAAAAVDVPPAQAYQTPKDVPIEGTPHYKDSFAREAITSGRTMEYRVHKVGNKYEIQGRYVERSDLDWEHMILGKHSTKKAAIARFAETAQIGVESFDSGLTAAITKRTETVARRTAERAEELKDIKDYFQKATEYKQTITDEMKGVKFRKTTVPVASDNPLNPLPPVTGFEYRGLIAHSSQKGEWQITHVNSGLSLFSRRDLSLSDARAMIYQLSHVQDWTNPAMGMNAKESAEFLKSNRDIQGKLQGAVKKLLNDGAYSDISEFHDPFLSPQLAAAELLKEVKIKGERATTAGRLAEPTPAVPEPDAGLFEPPTPGAGVSTPPSGIAAGIPEDVSRWAGFPRDDLRRDLQGIVNRIKEWTTANTLNVERVLKPLRDKGIDLRQVDAGIYAFRVLAISGEKGIGSMKKQTWSHIIRKVEEIDVNTAGHFPEGKAPTDAPTTPSVDAGLFEPPTVDPASRQRWTDRDIRTQAQETRRTWPKSIGRKEREAIEARKEDARQEELYDKAKAQFDDSIAAAEGGALRKRQEHDAARASFDDSIAAAQRGALRQRQEYDAAYDLEKAKFDESIRVAKESVRLQRIYEHDLEVRRIAQEKMSTKAIYDAEHEEEILEALSAAEAANQIRRDDTIAMLNRMIGKISDDDDFPDGIKNRILDSIKRLLRITSDDKPPPRPPTRPLGGRLIPPGGEEGIPGGWLIPDPQPFDQAMKIAFDPTTSGFGISPKSIRTMGESIANIPVFGSVIRGGLGIFNPTMARLRPIPRAMSVNASLRSQGSSITRKAMSHLHQVGNSHDILGPMDDAGLFIKGKFKGHSLNELKEHPYKFSFTNTEVDFLARMDDLIEETKNMYRRNGIELSLIHTDEMNFYAPRIYVARKVGEEVIELGTVGQPGPRLGGRTGAERQRTFPTIEAAQADGYVPLLLEEAVASRIHSAWNRVVDKNTVEWMQRNIPDDVRKDFQEGPGAARFIQRAWRAGYVGDDIVPATPAAHRWASDLSKFKERPRYIKELETMNKKQAVPKLAMLSADPSIFPIQLLTALFRHPPSVVMSAGGFARQYVTAIVSPAAARRGVQNLIADNRALLNKFPNALWGDIGSMEITTAAGPGGFLGPTLPKGPMVVAHLPGKYMINPLLRPFLSAYEHAMTDAGIHMLKAMEHYATDPESTYLVAEYVNKMRGLGVNSRLGINPLQSHLETSVMLAGRYRRTIAALHFDVWQGGLRGQMARRAYLHMWGGLVSTWIATTIGIGIARDETPKKIKNDLMEGLTNPARFLTYEIGGLRFGPGSKQVSDARMILRMATSPSTFGRDVNENPFFRWVRAQASPLVSNGWDWITGRDYMDVPVRGPWQDPNSWKLAGKRMGENFMPIWASTIALESGSWGKRGWQGLGDFGGLRAWPQGLTDILDAASWAKKDKPSSELSSGEMDDLINTTPEVQDAIDKIKMKEIPEEVARAHAFDKYERRDHALQLVLMPKLLRGISGKEKRQAIQEYLSTRHNAATDFFFDLEDVQDQHPVDAYRARYWTVPVDEDPITGFLDYRNQTDTRNKILKEAKSKGIPLEEITTRRPTGNAIIDRALDWYHGNVETLKPFWDVTWTIIPSLPPEEANAWQAYLRAPDQEQSWKRDNPMIRNIIGMVADERRMKKQFSPNAEAISQALFDMGYQDTDLFPSVQIGIDRQKMEMLVP